jgi:hypothetical protein
MKYKSIISTISFLLISMFYVSSASAGPTYLNVSVASECGTWEVSPGAQHCRVRGPSSGKSSDTAYFKCVGGGNGKGGVGIDTQSCGRIIFSHHRRETGSAGGTKHSIRVTTGVAMCTVTRSSLHGGVMPPNGYCVDVKNNTLEFDICGSKNADWVCWRTASYQKRIQGAHWDSEKWSLKCPFAVHWPTAIPNRQTIHPVKDSAWFFFELSLVCICNHCQYLSTPPWCVTRPPSPPQSQQHQRSTYFSHWLFGSQNLKTPHRALYSLSGMRMNGAVTFVLVVPSFINNTHKSRENVPYTLRQTDFGS